MKLLRVSLHGFGAFNRGLEVSFSTDQLNLVVGRNEISDDGAATLARALADGRLSKLEELALEERSLTTCAVLVTLGREAEQRLHFRGARNLGIERAKLEAMITHVAHHAGWPVAVSALRTLGEVWDEMDAQSESGD